MSISRWSAERWNKELTRDIGKTELNGPIKSPAKGPAGSLPNDFTNYKATPRRKSLRLSILKDRRQTRSPTISSPFPSIPALENSHVVDNGTPALLDTGILDIKGLASDDGQSPLSRRRSAKISACFEPVATGTEDQSTLTSDASLVGTVQEDLEKTSRSVHDCVGQDEKGSHRLSMSIDVHKRDTVQESEDPGDASINTVPSAREKLREWPLEASDSNIMIMPEGDMDMPQSHSPYLPPSPRLLESMSSVRPEESQNVLNGVCRNTFGTFVPHTTCVLSIESAESPFSDCRNTLKTVLDISDHDNSEVTSGGPLHDDRTDELPQVIYKDDDDELLDTEASNSGGSLPAHEDLDKESVTVLDGETSPDQIIDTFQQIPHTTSDEILDAGVATSEDSQLAAINDCNTDEESKSVGSLHGNDEGMLEENIDVKASHIRPRTRVSDETVMLKDFLSRAHARRAASRTAELSKPINKSPRKRSKRMPLQKLDTNSPSPTKPEGLVVKSGSLPEPIDENVHAEKDLGKANVDPVSQRRSTRTRLVAPAKAQSSVPSLIPLRRADGTDPVILQKSANQELSIVTRANTRRNKGRARLPKLMIAELAQLSEKEGSQVAEQENGSVLYKQETGIKSVRWDENQLVRFQEAPIDTDEVNEIRPAPKMRRLRGLGATNGTPAPKRVSQALLTPTASRRVTRPKAASY